MPKASALVKAAVLAGLIILPSAAATAQTSDPNNLRAVRIESPLKLDGVLDEEAWAKSSRVSNFNQRELVENEPATERTEVAARMTCSINPRLYGSVFGQWNNDDDEVLFNFRFTWIPKPGAYLYFVRNQFGDTLAPHNWQTHKTVAMIKFVWYFSMR